MSHRKPNRYAFRPSLDGVTLEERVVLSSMSRVAALQNGGFNGGGFNNGGMTNAQLNRANQAALNQFHAQLVQQFRSAQNNLRQYIYQQVGVLYSQGTPSPQALQNFRNAVNGAVAATTLQLSSQAALLPGSDRVVAQYQNTLMGNGPGSLNRRIDNIALNDRLLNNPLQFANTILRQVDTTNTGLFRNLSTNFNANRNNILRSSVDQTTGQLVPLNQFLANRAFTQFTNNLGSFTNAFPTVAQSLFANGNVPTADQIGAFNQQLGGALNTAAFQLRSTLGLFPGSQNVLPQLQNSFFGTGFNQTTGLPVNSLFNNLRLTTDPTLQPGININDPAFNPNQLGSTFQNAFGNTFGGVANPLTNFFGIQPNFGQNGLPTDFFRQGVTFPSLFNSQFTNSNFNSGFLGGFNSGFPGFGNAPQTGFNNFFGQGFNNFIGQSNFNNGFTQPGFTPTPINFFGTPGTGFGGSFGGTPGGGPFA